MNNLREKLEKYFGNGDGGCVGNMDSLLSFVEQEKRDSAAKAYGEGMRNCECEENKKFKT